MEYEYVAVPLVGGGELWKKCHFTYWQEYLLSDGWEEFVRAPWKPIAPGDTGGTCVFRREMSADEPRLWTEREIQELIYIAQWRKNRNAQRYKNKEGQ